MTTKKDMKVEMPSTNASGDPETIAASQETDDKSKTTGTTTPTPKTNQKKPQTRK